MLCYFQKYSKIFKNIQKHSIVGEHDSPAFKKQAENYFKSLKKGSLNVTMTEQPTEDHFSLVENLKDDHYSLSKNILTFMTQ